MAFEDAPYGDIRATLAVSQDEARTGSSRVVNLPGGRSVTVTVPAGIQDGAEMRLPGQGDVSRPGGKAGDLILRVAIIAPSRFEGQLQAEPAMPTEAMPTPFFSSATQAPTEYAAGGPGYPPAVDYYANSSPTEAVGGAYSPLVISPTPMAPQGYANYGAPPQYQAYAPMEPMYAPQQTPQPPRRRGGIVTLLIVLIVLVLLVGGGALYYIGPYQTNQLNAAATSTSQVQATGTAQIAQATANVAATSTAQAQATVQARQALYTQLTSKPPTLSDPLSSQSGNQWEELTSSANGTCGFSGGSYHAVIPKANFFQPCFAQGTPPFNNFVFQVDMTIMQGDEGGIIFRADVANDRFYLFNLGVDGSYNLYLYVNNQGAQAQTLLSGHTSLSKPANQSNEITLIAQGSSLSFYINQQYLNGVTDTTYSSGIIGVLGESQNKPTDAAFTNLKIWTL